LESLTILYLVFHDNIASVFILLLFLVELACYIGLRILLDERRHGLPSASLFVDYRHSFKVCAVGTFHDKDGATDLNYISNLERVKTTLLSF